MTVYAPARGAVMDWMDDDDGENEGPGLAPFLCLVILAGFIGVAALAVWGVVFWVTSWLH